MSNSTRLIYDIMFHAERKNKNGLLLLIDLKKLLTPFLGTFIQYSSQIWPE